jgi:hypothetical protein
MGTFKDPYLFKNSDGLIGSVQSFFHCLLLKAENMTVCPFLKKKPPVFALFPSLKEETLRKKR